eukprot:scaffold8750_cov60-Attheya_sp.AAC.2
MVLIICLATYTLWILICLALYVSLPPIDAPGDGDERALGKNPGPISARYKPQHHAPRQRQLELFQDLTIGKFLGKGSINVACFVELPDWWHEMHSVQKSQRMLMKVTADFSYAEKEIDALERLNVDKEEARRLKVLPLIVGSPSIKNPFYCADNVKGVTNCSSLAFPESFPNIVQQRLRAAPRLAALVVPYAEGKGYVFDELHTFDEARHFMKSMLGQLAHAHSVGINYLDLSGHRNVFVDNDGTAILFDWNGAVAIGKKAYNATNNFAIIPPEAWMEHVQGHDFKMMSVSAWDVWSAGVMFARLIYYPCRWATHHTYPRTKDRLRETILAIGGNTVIPVDSEFDLDLAQFLKVDNDIVRNREFKPHLVDRTEKHSCSQTSFKYLEDSTDQEKNQALDFLKSMMKISPLDRPDCHTLLKHPFLNN